MKELPYLSIVLAVRNDNYGGNFIQRLQNCIDWNTKLFENHKISVEFIAVCWNPVKENKNLKDNLLWPKNRKFVRYRVLTVSNQIHKKLSDPSIRKPLPLYEYLAKNVGIRRSKGEFVLSMNPDILLDENTVKWLAKKPLDKGYYYRANRIDFNESINQPTRIWLKAANYKIKRLPSTLSYRYFKVRTLGMILTFKIVCKLDFLGLIKHKKRAELTYHCNVSGDFMLMHKEAWFLLKGNPENTYIALHTDSLMVVMAAMGKLKEFVLKKPVYHQNHERRFDATQKKNIENDAAYSYYQNQAQEMIKKQKATIFNNKKWGLFEYEIPEFEVNE